jgi:hypothetical protein
MGELHPKTTKLQAVRFPHHAIGMKFADRRLPLHDLTMD